MKTSELQTVVDAGAVKLVFEYGFDNRDAFNAIGAGYLGGVVVELDDGSRHPVVFYDAVRLRQDLEEEAKQGMPFLAEPGLIVLTEVSLENMKIAVSRLGQQGYFARFKSGSAA
ncbi:MAG TPA: hypothetical protein VNH11_01800 [Pirellulales bacterium]|nr:hypothetical protein [Pirellulales bacterium]